MKLQLTGWDGKVLDIDVEKLAGTFGITVLRGARLVGLLDIGEDDNEQA